MKNVICLYINFLSLFIIHLFFTLHYFSNHMFLFLLTSISLSFLIISYGNAVSHCAYLLGLINQKNGITHYCARALFTLILLNKFSEFFERDFFTWHNQTIAGIIIVKFCLAWEEISLFTSIIQVLLAVYSRILLDMKEGFLEYLPLSTSYSHCFVCSKIRFLKLLYIIRISLICCMSGK